MFVESNATPARESGSVLIAALITTMLVGAFSGAMLLRGLQGQRSTTSSIQAWKLLFVAEAGLFL